MPTFDTKDPISVTLELGVGDVRVVASDRADTVVQVEPSDPSKSSNVTAAAQTQVEYANDMLKIKAPKGRKRFTFRGGESIVVRIELPTGSQLRGHGGVAGFQSLGTLGECHYRTGAGDIAVAHVAGETELTTGSGAMRIDRIDSSATIRNGNGDIRIGEVVGNLDVKAANGKIAVGQAHAAVTAKTANGDIHLDEVTRGIVVAETACGKVDVGVHAGTPAWLDLHTGFGHVHNLLDSSGHPEPSEETVEVRARSSFGEITVRRVDNSDVGTGTTSPTSRAARR